MLWEEKNERQGQLRSKLTTDNTILSCKLFNDTTLIEKCVAQSNNPFEV